MKRHLLLSAAASILVTFLNLSAQAKPKPVTSDELSKEALMIELSGKDYKKISEEALYAEIIGAYKNGNEIALKTRTQAFLKRFPQSQFADNALYLSGLMALQNRSYSEALRDFQKISKTYPNSNKAVSAQFFKSNHVQAVEFAGRIKKSF